MAHSKNRHGVQKYDPARHAAPLAFRPSAKVWDDATYVRDKQHACFFRSSCERIPSLLWYQPLQQPPTPPRTHVMVWLNRPTCTQDRKKWTFFWRWTSMERACTGGPAADHWRGLARRSPHYTPQTALVRKSGNSRPRAHLALTGTRNFMDRKRS